ncbi:hypothetical protein C823_000030 [Eubacterium plexicaudatum ASF492]|nr:hypothetical protein C823_000030 [Eubacterium plexicaudatum ASF492]
MISVDIPAYMINAEDKCKSDNIFINFSINHRENVLEILEELKKSYLIQLVNG